MLKNLEEILLFHYSIHFMQCTSTTGSKAAPEHGATTTMLDSTYSFLRFESLQTYLLSIWPNSLKGGASFFIGTLSVHGDEKLASLWTVMPVFLQFPVHIRLEAYHSVKQAIHDLKLTLNAV